MSKSAKPSYRIATIEGDGIGPEVTRSARCSEMTAAILRALA
ncbi:hypothetical protein [Jiella pelagia]|uniref:3-isopropylmalate dehydrogenase n=1 Tax=Jiella pelagia TaxID=2986949 RepID=A0ABY7BWR9_9HYPH|nr:hypothetical protein [Jiella pelagia]WAP66928.1 hypothetical protein OH818_14800 [Jiella pelagia]